jgi:3-hydroxyisobutyrate dehydrogenase-like beta-hydroxyacid dehydrogenase
LALEIWAEYFPFSKLQDLIANILQGMVKNLVEKGPLDKPIILYNRTLQRARDYAATLPSTKATVVDNIPAAVSQADIIFTCVGDDAALTSTIATALASSPSPKNKLFVDCSTVHPSTSNAISTQIIASGNSFLAMPVFGAPAMADAGQLIAVLSGPSACIDAALPYTTNVTSRAVIQFRDQEPGKATTLKIIGNAFILNMVEMLAEGHVLAEKSGLGSENLHQFIAAMMPGAYTAYSNRMMQGDYYKREDPLFAVDLARKDARHALDLAEKAGVKLQAVETAKGHLDRLKEERGDKGDLPGVYGVLRKEAGLTFENQQ